MVVHLVAVLRHEEFTVDGGHKPQICLMRRVLSSEIRENRRENSRASARNAFYALFVVFVLDEKRDSMYIYFIHSDILRNIFSRERAAHEYFTD